MPPPRFWMKYPTARNQSKELSDVGNKNAHSGKNWALSRSFETHITILERGQFLEDCLAHGI